VIDAPAPQAASDIVLFSGEVDGTRLEEIIDASAPTAVLPLNGSGSTPVRPLKLNQWGGIDG